MQIIRKKKIEYFGFINAIHSFCCILEAVDSRDPTLHPPAPGAVEPSLASICSRLQKYRMPVKELIRMELSRVNKHELNHLRGCLANQPTNLLSGYRVGTQSAGGWVQGTLVSLGSGQGEIRRRNKATMKWAAGLALLGVRLEQTCPTNLLIQQ